MNAYVRVKDTLGEQRIEVDELPLLAGGSAATRLTLPGPAGQDSYFQIDRVDGRWQISNAASLHGVKLNDSVISQPVFLTHGDLISSYGSHVSVVMDNDILSLEVVEHSDEFQTAPPVVSAIDEAGDGEAIIVSQFRRKLELAAAKPPRRSLWRAIVGGALAILAIVAWALFSAQSVRFDTVPETPDMIAISGGWMNLAVGDRVLLRPGNHTVRIRTEGYYDLERSFELGRSEPVTLRLEQEPLPGALIIQSEPEVGARIRLNGDIVGETPLRIDNLVRGKYDLEIDSARFLPWSGEISVQGLATEQTVTAQLVSAFGRVTVTSVPEGASIVSQGEVIGITPGVVEIPEGQQNISVMLDGFKPEDIDIAVMADADLLVEAPPLEKADGILTVTTKPSAANVTVDGKYRGQSPVRLFLAPGQQYVIQLSKAGYGRTTRTVRLQAAEGQELVVDLAARIGTVELAVQPSEAIVYVNGRRQADGKRQLRLPASPQRIEVKLPGYETYRKVVTPRPGFPQRLAINLRTTDQVRVAGITKTLTSPKGPVLRYVDPGSFTMGASRREPGRRANETLRQVTITRPYYIGTREITNSEFRLFRANHDSGAGLAMTLAGDKNPVANLAWKDAAEYCNWLSEQEGLEPVYEDRFGVLTAKRPTPNGYRLPTEAEWTWAARFQAGKGYLKFPWGAELPPAKGSGNYADAAAESLVPTILPNYDDGFAATAPVASFPGNALGIHDFGGNVAEWVHDYYQVYTPDSTRVWIDPEGPGQAKHNVIRGSSWRHASARELRFSYRDFGDSARPDVGFRVARTAPDYKAP